MEQRIDDLVMAFFGQDETKSKAWMRATNPHFSWLSPNDLIEAGLGDRLEAWILNQLYMGG